MCEEDRRERERDLSPCYNTCADGTAGKYSGAVGECNSSTSAGGTGGKYK